VIALEVADSGRNRRVTMKDAGVVEEHKLARPQPVAYRSRWFAQQLGQLTIGALTFEAIVADKLPHHRAIFLFDPRLVIFVAYPPAREGDLLDIAVNNNIVEKSGSWFSYGGERIGQGRENARAFMKENKDTMAKLEGEVRKKLGIGQPAPVPAVAQTAPPAQGARVTTMPATGTDAAKVTAVKR